MRQNVFTLLTTCILIIFCDLFKLDLKAQDKVLRFEHITVENGLCQNTIHGIVKDKYGFLWFGTWEGVCRYDGYSFKNFRAIENDSTAISNNRINYIFKDSINDVWIVTGDWLFCRYNYKTENFTRFTSDKLTDNIRRELDKTRHSRIHVSNSQNSWEIENKGNEILQTNNNNKKQIRYRKSPFDPNSLSDYILTNLYLDDNDILWVGTENGGINKADTRAKPFKNYVHSPIKSNSLIDNVIRAICEDNSGNIWIGTFNKGITIIDPKNDHYTHIQNNENSKKHLADNQIRSLYCDKYGHIWIGTKNGLTRYNPYTKEYFQYTVSSKKPIPHKWVFWIMEDHSGYLWIGTFNGIAKYDRKKDSFYSYKPDSLLKSKNVRVILEDRQFNLWIATEGGGITLLKRDSTNGFQEKLKPVKHFLYSPNDSNSLINNIVLTMAQDENGIIWVGTNNGLCQINPATNTIKRMNIGKEELPDNLIMGIVCDYKGHIWISHKKGISRLSISNLAIHTYTKSDGLQGNEFTQNAYFRSNHSGRIYMGGSNGLSSFLPDSIVDNPFYPPVVFTSLKVLNQPVQINQQINNHIILTESLLAQKKIIFHYGDKSIAIEFAGLHFSNPMGNKYKYMLVGFDNDWILTDGANRVANYSNLVPQKYIFKVMASNSDGLWNPQPATLEIVVLPPWWRSWWAYLIYTFFVLGILFFSYTFVVGRIEFRNQIAFERLKAGQMHELDQMKLEFFTNVSHELRTPLSLIIDPLEKLHNNEVEQSKISGYYFLMHRNAKRLLRLINQLLDFRKLESAKLTLELSQGDIVAFCKDVTEMFSLQAKQRNISLRFESFAENFHTCFDPDKLDKILFNLISNAFKYTHDDGYIDVNISKDIKDGSDIIYISVKDTGIGIPETSINKIFDTFYQVEGNKTVTGEGTGLGLALTKSLIELYNGEIQVESQPGKGSCFTVILPVGLLAEQFHTEAKINDNQKSFIKENPEFSIEDNILDTVKYDESSFPEILIIEDNTDVRNYLASELSSSYTILLSTNGKDGYNKAIDIIPDLIISDIMMPEMDGLELCKNLKTDERTSHIPVILLTARQSEKYKIEGYETGADAYITKPFNTTLLKAQIKNLIDSRRKLRELFGKEYNLDLKVLAVNITDEAFLNKAIDIVKENVTEPNFDIDLLSSKLKMSQRQLYRKIKALTDQTLHDFITTIRLNKASELLLSGDYTISEVAYKVGYSEPANFTRTFTKKFGKNPSTFIQECKKL